MADSQRPETIHPDGENRTTSSNMVYEGGRPGGKPGTPESIAPASPSTDRAPDRAVEANAVATAGPVSSPAPGLAEPPPPVPPPVAETVSASAGPPFRGGPVSAPVYGGTPPPPPAGTVPPTPPKKRRWGCIVGIIILVLLVTGVIGCLMLLNSVADAVSLAGAGGSVSPGSKISEEVIEGEDSGSSQKIAVIELHGVITGNGSFETASSRRVAFELQSARKDQDVAAIVLDMDTPGGEVTASDELYQQVIKCRNAGKPVITCMRSLAASGGYFVAAGSDWIVANRLTLTGSVGVIISTVNYEKLFEKIGLSGEVYKSGKMKDMLSGSRERTPEEVEYVNHLVQQTFREFAAIVADGRDRYRDADAVIASEFGDGRILNGEDAYRLGLVDEIGYFEDAVRKAKEFGNAPNAKVVRYRRAFRLSEILLSMKAERQLGLRGLLNAESREIRPGRLYFLLPSVMP